MDNNKRFKEVMAKYDEPKEDDFQQPKKTGMIKTVGIKIWKKFKSLIFPVVVIGISLFISLNFGLIHVSGMSMEPTYQNNDLLLCKRNPKMIAKNDIVVIDGKGITNEGLIIKRVVALEGDTVKVHKGRVYVNDKKIEEPYADLTGGDIVEVKKLTVPKGHVYVLGDNRDVSMDSRFFGAISLDKVESIICYDGQLLRNIGQLVYGKSWVNW